MAPQCTGADLFVEALETYGVEYVFGNPGTTELPITEALGDSDVAYRLALHEDVAVGMAAGYASTRRYRAHEVGALGGDGDPTEHNPVGVVNLHLAPGLAHGLGNLYGASVAGAPLVVTTGNHRTGFRHEEPILSGDVVAMAEPFTKWSAEVLDVDALPTMLRRAFRVALTPPTGPVFLALPLDVTTAETDADPERLGPIPAAGAGDPAALDRAADRLVAADAPAMVLGDGVARSGTDAVAAAVDLAEAAGARVHEEIMASEVDFPRSHEAWLSPIAPDEAMASTLMAADTLLLVGTSTNTTLVAHEGPLVGPDTTCIHVGDDAREIGKNHPADAAVLADPGEAMAAIAERVADRLDAETRERRLETVRATKEGLADAVRSMGAGDDDDPRASKVDLVDAMTDVAPDAYVVDEGVTARYALLTRRSFEPEGLIANKGGGLGYGLPAAVGAAIAEADRDDPRDVIGFVGDGSYLYYPQAIYTAARYGVDLAVVVVDNRNYRILKENAASLLDVEIEGREFVGTDFDPPVDLVANAESHGADAERAENPDEIGLALERALAADGPSVLDVLVHD